MSAEKGGAILTYQSVFQRYEIKYLISREQKGAILQAIEPYMALDRYGHTTIRNIYFDTPSYRLIRRSLEKPAYKEKLRIRSYRRVTEEDTVFVELKKKYRGVVYKRRVALPESEAMDWITGKRHCGMHTQITDEIDYLCSYYRELHETVFLSYERDAYLERNGGDFRVTFDEQILARDKELSLRADIGGVSLLPHADSVLMELKCAGGIPLWMVGVLSREGIRKTSFSKYGRAYEQMLFPTFKERGMLPKQREIIEDREDFVHA